MLLRDVSHELRSPLARLRLAADLAENNVADRSEAFHRIGLEVERIDAMIGQILEYSRADSGRPASHQTFDAAMLVGELVEDARIEAEARGLTFSLSLGDNALVDGNSCQVRVAVENVIRNAIRHAPEGSDVAVETAASCDEVRIIILDRGPGVDVGDPDWIFEPFRRGTSSNGSGLGLAITRRIVEGLGGRATAANRPTGGLSVELRLPKSLALASASGTRLAPVQPCAPD
jgi:signal transduction histidine kinase